MARRLAPAVLLVGLLLLASPAAGDNSGKIAELHAKIVAAQRHEAALNAQIAGVTTEIRSLEQRVGGVSQRLSLLRRDLALHQRRLDKLNALYRFETHRLTFLQREYTLVLNALNRRLVQIYESHSPSTFEVLLNSKSVEDAVEQLHYLNAIAQQDKKITRDVGVARDAMRVARVKTGKVRVVVNTETKAVAVRTQEQQSLRDQLLASQHSLSNARSHKQHALASTKQQEQDWFAEAQTLRFGATAHERGAIGVDREDRRRLRSRAERKPALAGTDIGDALAAKVDAVRGELDRARRPQIPEAARNDPPRASHTGRHRREASRLTAAERGRFARDP